MNSADFFFFFFFFIPVNIREKIVCRVLILPFSIVVVVVVAVCSSTAIL